MTPRELLDFLTVMEKMKCNTRHSWTSDGTHETVAAHSWRLSLMAMLMEPEFPELDMDKVLRMCVIHDIGEAVTGDIPTFDKTAGDEKTESSAVDGLLAMLGEPLERRWKALFAEMEALETPEARLYKALDRLEAVIQHNEADLSTWIPLEYDLQRTYGTENAAPWPCLKALREEMLRDTEEKIAAGHLPDPGALRSSSESPT